MDQFNPKHYNLAYLNESNGVFTICITTDSKIVLSTCLENAINNNPNTSKKYIKHKELDIKEYGPYAEYVILKNGICMSMHQLNLINYAVSVITFPEGFIILLMDSTLIYIVGVKSMHTIKKFDGRLNNLKKDYNITNTYFNATYISPLAKHAKFMIYFENTLFIINNYFEIKKVNDVIGYLCHYNILLTVNSKGFIKFKQISKKKYQYNFHNGYSLRYTISTVEPFQDMNVDTIHSITITPKDIHACTPKSIDSNHPDDIRSNLLYYYKRGECSNFYFEIHHLLNIIDIDYCDGVISCRLSDNSVYLYDEKTSGISYHCMSSNNQLIKKVNDYFIFECNSKLKYLKYGDIQNPKFEAFFNSEDERIKDIISDTKEIIYSYTLASIPYIVYLSQSNSIKILAVESLKFNKVSKFLSIGESAGFEEVLGSLDEGLGSLDKGLGSLDNGILELGLLDYYDGSYI